MTDMTPADVGAVLGNNDGFGGGNGGFWIFALIILCFLGRGFGWGGGDGGNGGGYLTTAESCNMNSFNELKSQVGRMNDMMFTNARQVDNAICNAEYTNLQNFNATQRQIADCCCEIKQLVQAEGNATRELIQANKIESMQQRINQLEMDQRFCGVPRVPTTFTYAVSPNFGSGCCGNNRSCNTLF